MVAEAHRVDHHKTMVEVAMAAIATDLRVLASHHELARMLDQADPTSVENLTRELLAFAIAKPQADQVRLLNAQGREVIRIDRHQGPPQIRPPEELQDKSDRSYVQIGLALPKHGIYLSQLELNQEHGRTSLPEKPIIHFMTPVFDSQNTKAGLLVINILGNDILLQRRRHSGNLPQSSPDATTSTRHEPLYDDTPILMTPGFPIPAAYHLHPHIAPLKKAAKKQENDTSQEPHQYFTDAGLITIQSVQPDLNAAAMAPTHAKGPAPQRWTLMTFVPETKLAAAVAPLRDFMWRADAILLIVIGLISWLCASSQVQRQKTQARLLESELRHRSVTESANDGLVSTDASGIIHSWNPAATRLFGVEEGQAIGKHLTYFMPSFRRANPNYYKNDGSLEGLCVPGQTTELTGVRKDGSEFPLAFSMATWTVSNREYWCGVIRDISERKRMEAQLKRMAITDGLTGLHNRAHFDSQFLTEFRRARRYQTSLSLMLMDIDFFKSVNDVYGHPVGDTCLIQVARVLLESCRDTDTVARYGGEEFVVIMPNTDSTGCATLAERIRAEVEQRDLSNNGSIIHRTLSIGVVHTDAESSHLTAKQLLYIADQALYEAKYGGRNRVVLKQSTY